MDTVFEPISKFSAIALTSFLSAIAIAISSNFNFWSLPNDKIERLVSGKRVILAFIIYFFTQVLLVPGLYLLWLKWQGRPFEKDIDTLTQAWINIYALITSTAFLIFYFFTSKSTFIHRVIGKDLFKNFLFGVMSWFIIFPIVATVGQIINLIISYYFPEIYPDQVAVKYLKKILPYPTVSFWLIACITIAAPIAEELLFRGFFLNWLLQKMKRWKAIVLSGVTFSLFHFSISQGISNIELFISLSILGCFLGFLYEKKQSLLAPIGLHSAFNSISVLMITMSEVNYQLSQ